MEGERREGEDGCEGTRSLLPPYKKVSLRRPGGPRGPPAVRLWARNASR